jgi:hypothetical protein
VPAFVNERALAATLAARVDRLLGNRYVYLAEGFLEIDPRCRHP